jgi:hypothetical protein
MKAQADMPVELVIAVIIMIMSTALAFLLINQSNEDKCLAELKTQTDVLQQAVYGVGLASPPTSRTVQFRPIQCGGRTIEALQFVHYEDWQYCGLCASRYGGCWQIIPIATDKSGTTVKHIPLYKSISCIDLAGNVWIEKDSDCEGDQVEFTEKPYSDSETDPTSWGIPTTVWDPENPSGSSTRWGTAILKGGRAYDIKLTKSAGATGCAAGEECGVIKVCVTKVT